MFSRTPSIPALDAFRLPKSADDTAVSQAREQIATYLQERFWQTLTPSLHQSLQTANTHSQLDRVISAVARNIKAVRHTRLSTVQWKNPQSTERGDITFSPAKLPRRFLDVPLHRLEATTHQRISSLFSTVQQQFPGICYMPYDVVSTLDNNIVWGDLINNHEQGVAPHNDHKAQFSTDFVQPWTYATSIQAANRATESEISSRYSSGDLRINWLRKANAAIATYEDAYKESCPAEDRVNKVREHLCGSGDYPFIAAVLQRLEKAKSLLLLDTNPGDMIWMSKPVMHGQYILTPGGGYNKNIPRGQYYMPH